MASPCEVSPDTDNALDPVTLRSARRMDEALTAALEDADARGDVQAHDILTGVREGEPLR